MAFYGTLIKAAATFLPLIKEYIFSSEKRKDILSLRTMTTWVIITLVISTGCSIYLSEQAIQNLNIHDPLIKQYNKLRQENAKLVAEQAMLTKNLTVCKEENRNVLQMCTVQGPISGKDSEEYVYDPKTHMMIPVSQIKK